MNTERTEKAKKAAGFVTGLLTGWGVPANWARVITGAIIGAVKQGKKTIAVPRLSKYGEHVDDHQTQIIAQFNELNLILGLTGVEQLEAAVPELPTRQFNSYESNTHRIIADIETFLGI